MAEYNQMYCIYSVNGKNYAVDLLGWANRSLSDSDLVQFRNDMAELEQEYKSFVDSGTIQYTDITETFTTADSISLTVPVGKTIVIHANFDIPQIVQYWNQRMQDDPCITKYNPQMYIL